MSVETLNPIENDPAYLSHEEMSEGIDMANAIEAMVEGSCVRAFAYAIALLVASLGHELNAVEKDPFLDELFAFIRPVAVGEISRLAKGEHEQ